MDEMELFGLTGGIASGKSTVAQRFRARGLSVIDADVLAREAVMPDTVGFEQIVARFGRSVVAEDGSINRKKLGEIVFRDPESLAALNAIVHPQIAALAVARKAELADRGEALACYEAALLVENHMQDRFRPLVVVSAPAALQIERICRRDGVTQAAAEARVAAQLPLAQKVAVADYVIQNDGNLDNVIRQSDEVLDAIAGRLGIDLHRSS